MILRLVGLRLFTAALTLLCVSAIVFMAVEILPGDVATNVLGQFSSETARAALREQLHLDEPAIERYFLWLGNVLRGNLGIALSSRRPIADILWPRITNTLILSAAAVAIYIPLALFPAVVQAVNRNRRVDHLLSAITLL